MQNKCEDRISKQYRDAFVSVCSLQNAHLTSHIAQCTVGLIFIDYKEGSFMYLHVPLALDSVSVNSCHGISDYAHMHDVPHYIWSFERACVFPPPRLCLSTYGFLYVPAATALSKGHKPLPEMGHFLLADRLCTVSLQWVCKRRSTVHKQKKIISKTYVTSFKFK